MRNFKALLFIAFTTLLWSACNKGKEKLTDSSPENSKDVFVQHGILTFKDSTVFRSYLSSAFSGKNNNVEFSGFDSYQRFYDEALVEYAAVKNINEFRKFKERFNKGIIFNPDSSIAPLYGGSVLQFFCNMDGKFMVGDKMYTLELFNSKNENGPESARVQQCSVPMGRISETIHYNSDHNRRLFIQLFNDPVPGSSAGNYNLYLRLYQEKKGTFGGWSTNNTNIHMNNLSYWGRLTFPIPFVPCLYHDSGQPQAYNWWNVSSAQFYPLGFYTSGQTTPTYEYLSLCGFVLSGNFTSGGVPNAPATGYSYVCP